MHKIKIGATPLLEASLKEICPNYNEIINITENIRVKYSNLKSKDIDVNDNVISILGARGSGKSSVLMSIRNIVESEFYSKLKYDESKAYIDINLDDFWKNIKENKNKEEKKTNLDIDIIMPTIKPELLENNDLLGWLIGYFFKEVEKTKKYWNDLNIHEKTKYIGRNNQKINSYCEYEHENPVRKAYKNLQYSYIKRKDNYKDLITNMAYSDIDKYLDDVKDSLYSDVNVLEKFKIFIREFIDFKKNFCSKGIKEPLIHIFFDDMDLIKNGCIKILESIIFYLSLPNIIVYIAGDYNNFLEKITLEYIKEEGILRKSLMDIDFVNPKNNYLDTDTLNILENKNNLAIDFLKKLTLPKNRFYLETYNLNNRRHFKQEIINKLDDKPVEDEKSLETLLNELIDNNHQNLVNGYFTIFDDKPRGLINTYSYLYDLLDMLGEDNIIDNYNEKICSKLEKLLNVLIDSKKGFKQFKLEILKTIDFKNLQFDFYLLNSMFEAHYKKIEEKDYSIRINILKSFVEINIMIVLILKLIDKKIHIENEKNAKFNISNILNKINNELMIASTKMTLEQMINIYGGLYNNLDYFNDKSKESLILDYIKTFTSIENETKEEVSKEKFEIEKKFRKINDREWRNNFKQNIDYIYIKNNYIDKGINNIKNDINILSKSDNNYIRKEMHYYHNIKKTRDKGEKNRLDYVYKCKLKELLREICFLNENSNSNKISMNDELEKAITPSDNYGYNVKTTHGGGLYSYSYLSFNELLNDNELPTINRNDFHKYIEEFFTLFINNYDLDDLYYFLLYFISFKSIRMYYEDCSFGLGNLINKLNEAIKKANIGNKDVKYINPNFMIIDDMLYPYRKRDNDGSIKSIIYSFMNRELQLLKKYDSKNIKNRIDKVNLDLQSLRKEKLDLINTNNILSDLESILEILLKTQEIIGSINDNKNIDEIIDGYELLTKQDLNQIILYKDGLFTNNFSEEELNEIYIYINKKYKKDESNISQKTNLDILYNLLESIYDYYKINMDKLSKYFNDIRDNLEGCKMYQLSKTFEDSAYFTKNLNEFIENIEKYSKSISNQKLLRFKHYKEYQELLKENMDLKHFEFFRSQFDLKKAYSLLKELAEINLINNLGFDRNTLDISEVNLTAIENEIFKGFTCEDIETELFNEAEYYKSSEKFKDYKEILDKEDELYYFNLDWLEQVSKIRLLTKLYLIKYKEIEFDINRESKDDDIGSLNSYEDLIKEILEFKESDVFKGVIKEENSLFAKIKKGFDKDGQS
ncbi:hypothetical protein WG909_14135 [Peptostreptococcaceae bacterium AGR-M142]